MPNTLIVPASGVISFSNDSAGSSSVPNLSSASQIQYDGAGGLVVSSLAQAASALTRFSVAGNRGILLTVTDTLTATLSARGVIHADGGNSNQWNSNYTTTNSNSASWSNTYILTSTDFIITQPSNWVVSTASNGVTATLPASPATGTTINFLDANKTWATNNLVLLRNGQTIESLAENLNCDISGFSFSLTYIGGSIGWRVY